jgi:basic membrane protein A and related proteins
VKRLLLVGIALLVAALAATGGSASHTLRPRVGFVAYAGSVPTRHTLGGMTFVGFVQAERKLPIQGRVKFISPTQGPRAVLESFGRQGYDLVISPLFDSQAVGPVALRFPRVQFLVIDAQPGSPPKAHAKNIHRAVFRSEQAGYLAGYLSALMAGRGGGRHMISAVGGYRFYGVTRWIVGFRAGAGKADSRIKVRVDYSDDFANPSKCRRVALSQIAAGSRVVFDVAGACGIGALRAAKEKGVWGVGVDIDQSFLGPYILTSAVNRLDRSVFDSVRKEAHGQLEPGSTTVYGIRNRGVELGRISPKVPKAFLRRLARIRRQIADGTITVPRPRG